MIVKYQGRENFLSSSPRNGEAPMSACVTGRQGLAKVLCGLSASHCNVRRHKSFLLIL
jgi:hypothetical protein